MNLAHVESAVRSAGFTTRGAFYPTPADAVLPMPDGGTVATVVLVGNAGDSMWHAFQRARRQSGTMLSLDAWTRKVLTVLARTCDAHALFPFDGPPYLPFQRWAQRAEPVMPSPIGPLIHPDYGLWHAYRGALAFARSIDFQQVAAHRSPCESCASRPCLTACPVAALSPGRYDVKTCRDHIGRQAGADCLQQGCLARRACPIGRTYMYSPGQIRFHMEAFLRNAKKVVGSDS